MVACFTSDAALGGPFLAKTRYHIACGRRKTASSPVLDPFVRLQKRLLNDDYAARRSICAFSAVEGMWAVRAGRVLLRRFDECDWVAGADRPPGRVVVVKERFLEPYEEVPDGRRCGFSTTTRDVVSGFC